MAGGCTCVGPCPSCLEDAPESVRREVELPLSACCGGYKQSPHDFCSLCPINGTVKDGEQ